MSKKQRRVLWSVLLILVSSIAAWAFIAGRPRVKRTSTVSSRERQRAQLQSVPNKPRNLSLQPAAFAMSRRLGRRFASERREISTVVGRLTTGSSQKALTIIRRQTDDGERVEITVAGLPGLLTWDPVNGALAAGARAIGSDRDLIERVVFDSPDQFVLAQLRGASYYTIARNVRPAGVGDGYAGATWTVVRVDDPETDPQKKPQSRWRLYYLNTATGLMERIISQEQGERIEAVFSGWSEQTSEKVPTGITWTRHGQVLMDYRLVSFAHGE